MTERHAATEEWRAIARGPRPLYHILTWPDIENWSEEEFYDVGRGDWEDFRAHWAHYWPELGGTCVEIGSGAGRLTRAIADDFERVELRMFAVRSNGYPHTFWFATAPGS